MRCTHTTQLRTAAPRGRGGAPGLASWAGLLLLASACSGTLIEVDLGAATQDGASLDGQTADAADAGATDVIVDTTQADSSGDGGDDGDGGDGGSAADAADGTADAADAADAGDAGDVEDAAGADGADTAPTDAGDAALFDSAADSSDAPDQGSGDAPSGDAPSGDGTADIHDGQGGADGDGDAADGAGADGGLAGDGDAGSSCDGGGSPTTEVCNQIDDDCDGQTDEGNVCPPTQIVGRARHAVSGSPLPKVLVELHKAGNCDPLTDLAVPISTTTTDAAGDYVFLVQPGAYCVEASFPGFQKLMTTDVAIPKGAVVVLNLTLTPTQVTTPHVQLCGKVTETGTGKTIAGATVTLFGDPAKQPLASAMSNGSGTFCLPPLPAGLAKLWRIKAYKKGYAVKDVGPLTLSSGQVGYVSITLTPTSQQVCHSESFEAGGWTASAPTDGVKWQTRHHGAVLSNSAAPACVQVPLDEACVPNPKAAYDPCALCPTATALACIPKPGALPRAYAGAHYAWFGNPKSGNYLGDLSKCVASNGGKTSVVIKGTYTSAKLKLSGNASDLRVRFHHWFEVESQSPGALHDQMTVLVSADGVQFQSISVLTPITLQAGSPAQGQTSAGYFTAPRWVQVSLVLPPNLSAAVKQSGGLFIRFEFDSADKEINGFRGWALDDVQVVGSGC